MNIYKTMDCVNGLKDRRLLSYKKNTFCLKKNIYHIFLEKYAKFRIYIHSLSFLRFFFIFFKEVKSNYKKPIDIKHSLIYVFSMKVRSLAGGDKYAQENHLNGENSDIEHVPL